MPVTFNGTPIFSDIPVGAIMMGPVSTMDGFLLCDGSAVSRDLYPRLFALIGTNFGYGDGSTTFNLPDYRGCFLRGLGGNSNASMYVKQNSAAPNITGEFAREENGYLYYTGAFTTGTTFNSRSANASGGGTSYKLDASRSSTVYQNDVTEVRPDNYAINYFIKY